MIVLSTFEDQILQSLDTATCQYDAVFVFDCQIHYAGQTLFGDDWGGSRVCTHDGTEWYPLMSMFLGRLRRKGLVGCYHPPPFDGYHPLVWCLRDTGRVLLGYPPQWEYTRAMLSLY